MGSNAAVYSEEGFWRFVAQRQLIWHRRHFLGLPPPWTEDPILQRYHFCNVYRRLDRGSIWYMQNVVTHAQGQEDLLFRTILYRLINNTAYFEALADVLDAHLPSELRFGVFGWSRWLVQRQVVVDSIEILGKPYNPAHIILQRSSPTTRQQNLFIALDSASELLKSGLPQKVLGARSFNAAWHALLPVEGVAGFTALQVVRDLIMAGALRVSEDEWCYIGPGAKETLFHLTQGISSTVEQQMWMKSLAESQPKCYSNLEMPLLDGEPPNLCDIEHSLCEYGKHAKISAGRGKPRKYEAGGPKW